MKRKGFTLIELLVVIAIIAMLMAILMPALSKVKKIAARVVCGTNLKGLGTAQMVYANDYDDEFVVQGAGGDHTWANATTGWQLPDKDWRTPTELTVGASLYLLVRDADVSPKSFVCPSSDQKEYDGKNPDSHDIVDLWDFASPTYEDNGPGNCVSYSYHNPYDSEGTVTGKKSKYAADGTRSAAFAVMADQNPWFEADKLTLGSGSSTAETAVEEVYKLGCDTATDDNIDDGLQKFQIQIANAMPHDRESQNVLFADGHATNEKRTDVGVTNDNIYTKYPTAADPLTKRTGYLLNNKTDRTAPGSMNDSVLVNDGDYVQ